MRPSFIGALGTAIFFLSLAPTVVLADSTSSGGSDSDKKQALAKPCTIRSPSSGLFFDVNTLSILPLKDGASKKKDDRTESWHAKGYDYGTNFTLNFCAPVVEAMDGVMGVDPGLWRNVSAFYNENGKTYSIGQQNSELVFRGSKLVLNYTDGSPCEEEDEKFNRKRDEASYEHLTSDLYTTTKKIRRKSTIISLLCQKEVLPTSPKVTVAFVGASQDKCTYFFEARSLAACAGIESTPSQLSPGGVFGVIFMIAVLAYLVGGCVYQRTVMHQRGWRQLPNYSMWAGMWGFFSDFFIILSSSCLQFLPGRRGYSRLSLNGNGNARARNSEDENRLIDQLDEEWED